MIPILGVTRDGRVLAGTRRLCVDCRWFKTPGLLLTFVLGSHESLCDNPRNAIRVPDLIRGDYSDRPSPYRSRHCGEGPCGKAGALWEAK